MATFEQNVQGNCEWLTSVQTATEMFVLKPTMIFKIMTMSYRMNIEPNEIIASIP